MTKKQIRDKILFKLKIQKEEERERKSKLILEKLLKTEEFIKAKIVMFYIAFDGEVNTEEMIREARKLGKIVTVPVVRRSSPLALSPSTRFARSGRMLSLSKQSKVKAPVCKKNRVSLRPCRLDDNTELEIGPYGVCEPKTRSFIRLKDLDLVIVPAFAFDKKGNRLGRGKGCYDYFLKRIPKDTPSVGLAFDFQILPILPTTTHDISVKKVIFA